MYHINRLQIPSIWDILRLGLVGQVTYFRHSPTASTQLHHLFMHCTVLTHAYWAFFWARLRFVGLPPHAALTATGSRVPTYTHFCRLAQPLTTVGDDS